MASEPPDSGIPDPCTPEMLAFVVKTLLNDLEADANAGHIRPDQIITILQAALNYVKNRTGEQPHVPETERPKQPMKRRAPKRKKKVVPNATPELNVPCPGCFVNPGVPCKAVTGGSHSSRMKMLGHVLGKLNKGEHLAPIDVPCTRKDCHAWEQHKCAPAHEDGYRMRLAMRTEEMVHVALTDSNYAEIGLGIIGTAEKWAQTAAPSLPTFVDFGKYVADLGKNAVVTREQLDFLSQRTKWMQ